MKSDEKYICTYTLPFYLATLLLTHTEGRGEEREGEEGRGWLLGEGCFRTSCQLSH